MYEWAQLYLCPLWSTEITKATVVVSHRLSVTSLMNITCFFTEEFQAATKDKEVASNNSNQQYNFVTSCT